MVFITLGVLSYIVRESLHHLVASILLLQGKSFSNTIYKTALEWTEVPYSMFIIYLCLILGLIYLIWEEISKKNKN